MTLVLSAFDCFYNEKDRIRSLKKQIFYNRTRQHSTLGYRSPAQHLEDWMKKQNQENLAA